MILFPAVDIKGGKAVRLRQGRAEETIVFEDDPVKAALSWQEAGAEWLHIIDLDGAFKGIPYSEPVIRDLCEQVRIPVQLGGGIRDMDVARAYLDAGVQRLIIGTMALEDPVMFKKLCAFYPGRIGVSLDAQDGVLKTKGWVESSNLTVDDVLPRLDADGAAFIIYTDISRDGMHSGVNVAAMEHICARTRVPVIAAGGVSTLKDIKALHHLSLDGVLQGVISGRALYEGTLKLEEALAWLQEQ